MECQKELGHLSFEPIIADYYEGAVAQIKCARGHESALMLQSQKFEILLESAANALLEGYTLEASSSLSSALERFFKFSLKVLCKKEGIPQDQLEITFKQVSRQSERQFGAFLFIYLLTFGSSYKINDKIVEFRNKVIHKGYIPTPTEVENFAEKVYSEIYNLTRQLKEYCDEKIMQVIMDDLGEKNRSLPNDMPRATTTGATFFSLSHNEQKSSFKEALASYKEAQSRLFGSVPYMKLFSKAVGLYGKVKNDL